MSCKIQLNQQQLQNTPSGYQHFRLNNLRTKYNNTQGQQRRTRSCKNNSFDLMTSRDSHFIQLPYHQTYCATDFYDINLSSHTKRGKPSPVIKRKVRTIRIPSEYVEASPAISGIRDFDGYISRHSPFRNWLALSQTHTQVNSNRQQIQKINKYVNILEANKVSETKRLAIMLENVNNKQQRMKEPKVNQYERIQTPNILKSWRVRHLVKT